MARLLTRLLAAIVLVQSSLLGAAETSKPNFIYILADDLGYTDVGWHGDEIKTPHLDRLANNGAKLEAFYVQPVCSPTRAALMTGRYPMRHGLQVGVVRPWAAHGLPLDERTLPAALAEAGYETAISGKWHLGHFKPEYQPTKRGFQHQYGHYNGALDYFTHDRDGGHDWHKDDKVNRDEGYSTVLIGDEAVRRIKEREKSKPLFLYVPFNAVHSPLQALEKDLEKYAHIQDKKRRAYCAMMSCLDDQVGRIVKALDDEQIRDKTLIVFSSDNGGPLGLGATNGTLRAGKGSLYEGGVRVCALAHWPGKIKAGTVVNEPLHIVDIYPTLLTLAGASLEQKTPLDGRDAWAAITQGAKSTRTEILHNTTPTTGAIRIGDWKLILNGNAPVDNVETSGAPIRRRQRMGERMELFNIAEDRSEKNNLAESHPDKVKELKARYDVLAAEAVPPKNEPKPAGFQVPKVWGEAGQ
ncbi:Arylsulfatase [Caulifigura coniformis]|uniref:Arylsulfatase n=1 Tax=Caulifigura coniformis TaxID=2527983 RepID=A0A517SJZ9_9PLAN|nr:arylsulfatase [Caulifigura coniformis]QDT56447.1 Arylsulfatase [Caulifigura coniformis]